MNRLVFILLQIYFVSIEANSDVVYYFGENKIKSSHNLKIISLAPSITETLYAIGIGEWIIGVTRYDDFPEDVRNKEIIGGYIDVDVEKILKLSPDVVVCEPNSGIKESVQFLSSKGIPVLVVNINSIKDILEAIEDFGRLFGKEREARELLNNLLVKYKNLQKYYRGNNNRSMLSALVVLNENPLMVAGYSSFVGELINLVGLENAYKGRQKYPVLDIELLHILRPDIIFNISELVMAGGSAEENKKSLLIFGGKIIYDLRDSTFIRPSPRFVDALEKLCSLISGYYCY
ncbi:MAG: helical backbone metal receptor [Deltaproteobacteria bacterium]|nr:helical backbone metal receptor [Deltaproteobacteria bacterium]